MKPLVVSIYFVVLTALLLVWAYTLKSRWTRPSKIRSVLLKFSISFFTSLYLFLMLEILFYSVVTPSDGFGFTLASQRWGERYWRPINSFGYRDVEHSPNEFQNKEIIFIVGDSIVAGHGIRRIEDRFSDILQRSLGDHYLVLNIARSGWNTAAEYQAIISYPHQPKRIVLSYFINDIEGAAQKQGYVSDVYIKPPASSSLAYCLDHSYFLNFVYWRLYRFRHSDIGLQYWDYLKQSYSRDDVWRAHEKELDQIAEHARKQGIELTVVVFPNLNAVKESAPISSMVTEFFQSRNVRVLNLEPRLEDRDPATLVVNSLDGHPNEALNREVGELLIRESRGYSGLSK